ncbi:hypothetical protein [Photobacterium kishitanii]|uniref:Uncharacterized protein n=1 Tax=Photobacterium kishitanii TaxID=318456 RepID=A0A2T3KMT8_9GAMM|nr:hypothetical protein [Photobacterium kishitanii]PSV01065.1 hypothetical protein C9J27_03340 [Photobacterium kishitanii]
MIIKKMDNMQPHKEVVREFELKEELAFFCVRHIKKYARKRIADLKSKRIKSYDLKIAAFERLIAIRRYDIEYATLISILFANEFLQIKDRVLAGKLSLEHISDEGYWKNGGRNIGIVEAIHFSYTFFSEAYPQSYNIIELMLLVEEESDEPVNSLEFISKIIGDK